MAVTQGILAARPNLPDAPSIGTVTVSGSTATVPYTAPANNGGFPVLSYTARSSLNAVQATVNQSASGTITVSGLSGGAQTFTVFATTAVGSSANSAVSNSVTAVSVPGAATITGTVTVARTSATSLYFNITVPYQAPVDTGGATLTEIQAIDSSNNIMKSQSYINWSSGLTGSSWTFEAPQRGVETTIRLRFVNSQGIGASSAPSNLVRINLTKKIGVLLVAGGGGGGGSIPGYQWSGGGGGGGYLDYNDNIILEYWYNQSFSIAVGGGGAGPAWVSTGGPGGNSSFDSYTAYGGGGGACWESGAGPGGSGGGGAFSHDWRGCQHGAAGTPGQGNNGGGGYGMPDPGNLSQAIQGYGGGGGGQSAAGSFGSGNNGGGKGGNGIVKFSSPYSGGGGGAAGLNANRYGGLGPHGGGAGARIAPCTGATCPGHADGFDGTANTGGGGGGAASRDNTVSPFVGSTGKGGNGGSGRVIIYESNLVYSTPVSLIGGVVGSAEGFTTITFNGNGSIIYS